MAAEPHNLTLATTGASGAAFLREMLLLLERDERVTTVNFVASDNALRVMAEELTISGRSNLVRQLLGAIQEDSTAEQRRYRRQRGQRLLSQ